MYYSLSKVDGQASCKTKQATASWYKVTASSQISEEIVMSHSQIAPGLIATLMGLIYMSAPAHAQGWTDCPTTMPRGGPQATASYQMLDDVCFVDQFPISSLPILLYDDFSWRSFLALVWPAKHGQRG